jgi:hypothetical protein
MKILKYKRLPTVIVTGIIVLIALLFHSCTVSQKIEAKSGAQLWAENCQRCHNTPSPSTFSGDQWETVGMHMQTRALLTDKERDKIVGFLKTSSN